MTRVASRLVLVLYLVVILFHRYCKLRNLISDDLVVSYLQRSHTYAQKSQSIMCSAKLHGGPKVSEQQTVSFFYSYSINMCYICEH